MRKEAEDLLKDKKEYTKMQRGNNKFERELEGLSKDATSTEPDDARQLKALIGRRRDAKRENAHETGYAVQTKLQKPLTSTKRRNRRCLEEWASTPSTERLRQLEESDSVQSIRGSSCGIPVE